jgi:NCS1 family nucleobase:cation symporter-1
MIIFGAAILLVAYIGYELIHRLGVYLTVMSGLLFLATATLLITHEGRPIAVTAPLAGATEFAVFMATLTQATAWSLTFGPYVADYSRYLRPDVPTASTFWYTAMGNFLGAGAIMCLGAYMASRYAQIAADPGVGIAGLFGPAAPIVKGLIVLGVFQAGVMNLYSAFMSASTVFSGFNRYGHIGPRAKLVILAGVMILATAIAILTQNNFHRYFGDMLDMMVYVLVPWSAVNLTDYYVVRRGSYAIDGMFDPGGIYGRFNWPTIIIYGLSIAVEAPFARVSFYTGPIAQKVGADIAWLPGLIVPAILYCLMMRNRAALRSV